MRACVGLLAGAWAASTALAATLPSDPSYVVQIHSSREGFVPPADASSQLRTQFMTTESGQRFECFLPLSPLQKKEQAADVAASKQAGDAKAREDADDSSKYLAFARAAAKKVRPMCLQYVDVVDRWVYEVCPGVLIRKVNLKRRGKDATKLQESGSTEEIPQEQKKTHEVQELAAFESDSEAPISQYEEFTHGNMQARVTSYKKTLYTQIFRARGKPNGQEGDVELQFLCSASARDDQVSGVRWRQNSEDAKEPAAFIIASRLFCNPKHADPTSPDEKFSVRSLLQPLAEFRTCIKRNEGWWTYEFCFGHGIRQYHRETDGKVSAEFSLGSYDSKQNAELEASDASLVTEHIDATHDSPRPAFVEVYSGGTHCKEFDVSTPRKSRVYYYCNQGSTNHHILSVKETQTCTYTIKISSPIVCDHPHFITEEEKVEDKSEVVHCIPVPSIESTNPESSSATRAPTTGPKDDGIREVEVTAA